MGVADQALDVLEGCHQKMPAYALHWTKNDSDLASLHEHPRYRELIRRGEARLAAIRSGRSSS